MEDEALVEAVRRRNIIYEVGSINYRNNDIKECAWTREIIKVGQQFSKLHSKCCSLVF